MLTVMHQNLFQKANKQSLNKITMKELIKKAKEIGFLLTPELITSFSSNYVIDVNYLWMCELRRWLRDEKGIFLLINPGFKVGFNLVDTETIWWYIISEGVEVFSDKPYETYEESLKKGLIEAIDLIAKDKKKE